MGYSMTHLPARLSSRPTLESRRSKRGSLAGAGWRCSRSARLSRWSSQGFILDWTEGGSAATRARRSSRRGVCSLAESVASVSGPSPGTSKSHSTRHRRAPPRATDVVFFFRRDIPSAINSSRTRRAAAARCSLGPGASPRRRLPSCGASGDQSWSALRALFAAPCCLPAASKNAMSRLRSGRPMALTETYAEASRRPVQLCCFLCSEQHSKEQVSAPQRGQQYLRGFEAQTQHGGAGAKSGKGGSTSALRASSFGFTAGASVATRSGPQSISFPSVSSSDDA
mmetsp:Transcript_20608/g.70748  ORF Transcript_20608/g.70748 Transcript_20608/m.70748 type:complete len:283 (+) Transcript_20608:171-1019(+)